ncbi:hypothetical protein AiwAL_07165 [Acidiphilium sp. AL]|uniref:hypothetical protein n=1 Tax=Acidiphilium sp. AL TaxID=2871704 RepID=UPI0021CB4030|nr:hypothetical protein [Acidiphilium sp. AL]MCU4159884.1 hypothetical protein [Acidiphilium sp. AL]
MAFGIGFSLSPLGAHPMHRAPGGARQDGGAAPIVAGLLKNFVTGPGGDALAGGGGCR